MKKISLMFFICAFAIPLMLPAAGHAAPATARGEKAAQVEQLLKYLSYTAEGDGDQVVYVLCGAQCPRCARVYNAFADEPMFRREFQVRWVLYPDEVGYLFPLENKPGAGMKELYGNPQQIEPRSVENSARLETVTKYNEVIIGMVSKLFDGRPSVPATPFMVIKTQDGFEYGAVEDFWRYSAIASFSKALPLAEGVDIYNSGIMKDVDEAEKLVGYNFFAVEKDAPVRLFPRDDAPEIEKPVRKGRGGEVRSKTRNGWVGFQLFRDPDAPLAYVKLQGGVLQKK